jgi:serine/threonine-protein kinase
MAEPAIGATLAGYRIDELIGRGGMGVVYRATHLALERPVALKLIARQYADQEGFRARFQRESRLAARLDHPSVVPVFDSREVDGELLVAMRLVEGGDLRGLIEREGPLPPERALDLLSQVADALDAAHAAGIVHRDVKPHNVLVEGDRAFLSDFGLAKALDESGASGGSVVGTVEYMAPEQWRGEAVGPAADVYSLGCVLYESLSGVAPLARLESGSEPQLPAGIDAAIERAVSKRPGDRFPSAAALIDAARSGGSSDQAPTRVLAGDAEQRPRAGSPASAERSTAALERRRVRRFQRRAVAAVPLVLLATIAAGFVAQRLFGGSGGVTASVPIPIGTPPLRVTADGQGAWVTSARDGTLTWLEPATGGSIWTKTLSPGISGAAIGSRWLWVTNPRRHELLRVDWMTGRVKQSIRIPGAPGPIALGGDRVWVADEEGGGITVVDAQSGRRVRTGLPPHAAPLRLAVGAGGLWVSSASTGTVRRIDLDTLRPGEAIPAGRRPAGITVAHGLVWVANPPTGTVTEVDPSLHQVGDQVDVGGRPGGIDAGTSTVWVADADAGTVSRIDIAGRRLSGGPVDIGAEPGAVAIGGDAVWIANNGDGTVVRLEP